jgi:hypothetical protein
MGYTLMHRSRSTAHLNGAYAPTMRGVHASPNDVATAIVIVRIVVTIRVIGIIVVVVIRIEAAAKSETVPEAATMESAAVEAAGHAAAEAAAMESTTSEAATMESATAEASTMKAAAASEASAAVAATATSATRQGHCWRHQAKERKRRKSDNCFTQHSHSPSVISLPTTITVASCDRFRELPAKFAQLHAIRILNLMSGRSSLLCELRARCVQQKSPVEANPNLPSRGRKIRHGVEIMRETVWVVFAWRLHSTARSLYAAGWAMYNTGYNNFKNIK